MSQRYDVIVIGGGHAGAEAAARVTPRRPHAAVDPEPRDDRSDVVQSGDRRNREGDGRAGGRRPRRRHGPCDRLGPNPVSHAEPVERTGGVVAARAVRPGTLSARRAFHPRTVHHTLNSRRDGGGLVLDQRTIRGVSTLDGRRYEAPCVILTAGTFLRGLIHLGLDTQIAAGRAGESHTVAIAEALERLGLIVERFKTGTPPRIDGRSVDLGSARAPGRR